MLPDITYYPIFIIEYIPVLEEAIWLVFLKLMRMGAFTEWGFLSLNKLLFFPNRI